MQMLLPCSQTLCQDTEIIITLIKAAEADQDFSPQIGVLGCISRLGEKHDSALIPIHTECEHNNTLHDHYSVMSCFNADSEDERELEVYGQEKLGLGMSMDLCRGRGRNQA